MNREEIYETLHTIFWDVFDDASIRVCDATTAKDVEGWDSLTHITLINTIEDVFGVTFQMKEIVKMKNVGELVDVIQREL